MKEAGRKARILPFCYSFPVKFFILFLALTGAAHSMQIKKSKVILDKLDDYSRCHEKKISGSWCHKALTKWVKSHPEDAFKAGKLTRLFMNHWLAVPFFAKSTGLQDFNCKDNDLKLAVIGGLNLPMTGNEEVIAASEKIIFEKCPKEMKDAVYEAAVPDSNLFVNVCKRLELTGSKKQSCDYL